MTEVLFDERAVPGVMILAHFFVLLNSAIERSEHFILIHLMKVGMYKDHISRNVIIPIIHHTVVRVSSN